MSKRRKKTARAEPFYPETTDSRPHVYIRIAEGLLPWWRSGELFAKAHVRRHYMTRQIANYARKRAPIDKTFCYLPPALTTTYFTGPVLFAWSGRQPGPGPDAQKVRLRVECLSCAEAE
jgi:hypothetical protein